jgi:hypothetical protein
MKAQRFQNTKILTLDDSSRGNHFSKAFYN